MSYSYLKQSPKHMDSLQLSRHIRKEHDRDPAGPGESESLYSDKSHSSLLKNSWCERVRKLVQGHEHHPSKRHGWKPWTIRPPALLAFILLSVILAIAIEILVQRSQSAGALALSTSVDEISNLAGFASLYLPTVIAVLYASIFTIVDLNVKRIQPWIELSKPEGATAENSLLLDYPFELLAFVPFTAARRRHWPVFYAGTIMMVVFWSITPLQSSIFGAGSIILTRPTVLSSPNTLIPLQEQAALIDGSVLNGAFATTWLNQTFPSSMTAASATVPFRAIKDPDHATDVSWIGWTWQLTTELKCWPAVAGNGTYTNGQGCSVPKWVAQDLDGGAQVLIRYIGYYENAALDYYLQGPTCSSVFAHQFLAVAAQISKNSSVPGAATVLFCEPSYYKRNITVTIDEATFKPNLDTLINNGPLLSLSDEEFNRTALEYLVATGVPAIDQVRNYTGEVSVDQWSQISERFGDELAWPFTNMVGFAVGSRNYTATQLLDSSTLIDAFTAAHKTVFSIAVSKLIAESSSTQAGNVQFSISGILVSRPISAVVEGLLVLVAVLSGLLLYHCRKAETGILKDPRTLGKLMAIFQQDERLLQKFAPLDQLNREELIESIKDSRFRLHRGSDRIEPLYGFDQAIPTDPKPDRSTQNWLEKRTLEPIRPHQLRASTGAFVLLALTAGISVLGYLKYKEIRLGGLPRPSQSFEVLQLLENYIPTVFATLLEPFWVLINRFFCLVQPYRALQAGKSPPERSLEVDYNSLLPQFTIWRAIRSRHFFLAIVCLITLLANVLAVGLGGIFDERPIDIQYAALFQPQRNLSMVRSTFLNEEKSSLTNAYADHLQVVLSNLSAHTELPSWTSSEVYFMPFAERTYVHTTADSMKTRTTGISVEPKCSSIPMNADADTYVHFDIHSQSQQVSVYYEAANGSETQCGLKGQSWYYTYNNADVYNDTLQKYDYPYGRSALEVSAGMFTGPVGRPIAKNSEDLCSQRLLAGWVRVDATDSDKTNSTVTSTFIQCEPILRTALYDVEVDTTGSVLNYERVDNFENFMSLFPKNQTKTILSDAIYLITFPSKEVWHNTTVSGDWLNTFLSLHMDTTEHLDPTQPVPKAEAIIPALESVFQELVAVLFGLNPDLWSTIDSAEPISGVVIRNETRIFMSYEAFLVSMVILCLNIAVVLVVYIRGLGVNLPRLPTTIGSILAYVAASRAVRDYREIDNNTTKYDGKVEKTYTFGRFNGMDGKPHIGIELDPCVIPLSSK